jgi:hypothetical protein
MVILTVLCAYTVIGFTLDANDSHLRLPKCERAKHHFGDT